MRIQQITIEIFICIKLLAVGTGSGVRVTEAALCTASKLKILTDKKVDESCCFVFFYVVDCFNDFDDELGSGIDELKVFRA